MYLIIYLSIYLSKDYNSINNSIITNISNKIKQIFNIGTATIRQSIYYSILLILLKTISQVLTNIAMRQINYPAKVLFKSANPIITMFIGIYLFIYLFIFISIYLSINSSNIYVSIYLCIRNYVV
jgi:hypothetical protein